MKLLTEIPLERKSPSIDYQSKVVLLGSCFSEHIAAKLDYYKFQILSNPFGSLFHPCAIENLMNRSFLKKNYSEDELFLLNGGWHCFDAHSKLSNPQKEVLLMNLNNALELTHQRIIDSTHIIITLGTAWVYRSKKNSQIVANCHKVPQKEFSKELLSVQLLTQILEGMVALIRSENKDASIVFTISPVRHLKDGVVENTRSKAHLATAVHEFVKGETLSYFPSYELLIDELRDYRFYERDLVHPNELAIDYVWDRFKSTWISEEVYPVMEAVRQIQKGLQHRPFNPKSKQHELFRRGLQAKIEELQKTHPFMAFKDS